MATIAKMRNEKLTPFGLHDKLHVEGKNLVDKKGKKVLLKGLSSHNMSSFPKFLNEEGIRDLVNIFDFDIFRFAMYSASADGDFGYADGNYDHKVELENLLLKGVETCAKLGIYALIDWHILLEETPMAHKDEAIAFFKKISAQLKDYDNVIYEICNEPNGPKAPWDVVYDYAMEVIPVIRENDPDKIIIVGTPMWSQDVHIAAEKPLPFENIMYTLHFYADTHKEELRDKARAAIEKGLPIFVTEFGVCNAQGDGDINVEESKTWIRFLKENDISFILWNLSNKDETSAILSPDCRATYGYKQDDFSPCGKFIKELFATK